MLTLQCKAGLFLSIVIWCLQSISCPQPADPRPEWVGAAVNRLSSPVDKVRAAARCEIEEAFPKLFAVGLFDSPWMLQPPGGRRRIARSMLLPQLDTLRRLIHDTDDDTAILSLTLIGAMEDAAAPAVADLQVTWADDSRDFAVRWAALRSLLMVTPDDQSVLASLLSSFETLLPPTDSIAITTGTSGFYSAALAMELAKSGHTTSELDSLVELASSNYPLQTRLLALNTLYFLGEEARPAVPSLWSYLSDADPLRQAIADTIVRLTLDPSLFRRLADQMQLVGAGRQEKISQWQDWLANHRRAEQETAQDLAEALTEGSGSVVAAMLHTQLMYGSPTTRREVLRMLSQAPTPPSQLALVVRHLATDRNTAPETRSLAQRVLEKMQPTGGITK